MPTEEERLCRKKDPPKCRFHFLCVPVKPTEPCRKCPKWMGKTCPLPHIDPNDVRCVYKPFLKLGLLWIAVSSEFLRHILFPRSCRANVVYAKGKDDEKDGKEGKKVRSSELPLYIEDEEYCVDPTDPTILQNTISCVRQEAQGIISESKVIASKVQDTLAEISEKTESVFEYLHAEENILPRFEAIALGGIAGYIWAIRCRLFRRLLYTGSGAAAMAALCYPSEAKELAEEAVLMAKKYVVNSYQLINEDND